MLQVWCAGSGTCLSWRALGSEGMALITACCSAALLAWQWFVGGVGFG